MLQTPSLKILLRIGLITGGIVVLYQLSNLFLVYHYIRNEYAIVVAAVIALATGVFLTKKYSARGSSRNKQAENPLDRLTQRELQILELIHQGKTNKEIAAVNFVELTTVKTHVNNLYAKLAVDNRKAASKMYDLYAFGIKSSFSPPPKNA